MAAPRFLARNPLPTNKTSAAGRGDDRRARLGGEGPDPAVEWKPTVDRIVAVGSTQGHQDSTGRYRGASPARSGHCNEMSYLRMVGAGRFERPTPCAQDMLIPSLGHQ